RRVLFRSRPPSTTGCTSSMAMRGRVTASWRSIRPLRRQDAARGFSSIVVVPCRQVRGPQAGDLLPSGDGGERSGSAAGRSPSVYWRPRTAVSRWMSAPLATLYRHAIEQQGFVSDAAQWQAVARLDDCLRALHAGEPTLGIYLWGPVGRGKTWLMDRFQQSLQLPSRRQHFHHFMRWVHRRLFKLTGTPDPLQALADELSAEVRVLCFDELFVSDIGDATLLGGLFQKLFARGLVLVATSNQPPSQLYADGFNRERFLPAIAALERHMQ